MHTRRAFLKQAGAALTVASTGTLATSCTSETFSIDSSQPNIILITADDLGWKDLPCYGNKEIKTPNIDRLAREGVTFTHAFVVASSCAPSRSSLITGQYPHTNGVTGLTHIYKTRQLSPFHDTLADYLKEAGYNTALEGKWHVAPYIPTNFYGYNERLSSMLPKGFWIKDSRKAVDFIKRNKDNRFYLELNYMHNHRDGYGEFKMDPDFPVDPEKITVPEYWTLPDSKGIREDIAKFYSQTMKMDKLIGDVLNTLDDLKLTENTLVVFISDNGPPYPGNKMSLYDRGAGTPLLMRWPKRLKAGTVVHDLTNSIDVMPTILDYAGITVPREVQGISLKNCISGKKPAKERNAIFMEMTDHVFHLPTRAVRTQRYKFIKNHSDIAQGLDQNNHDTWAHELCKLPNQPWKKPRVPEELYDLKKDPNEQKNLVNDPSYATVLKEMQGLLKKHMKDTNDPYLGKPFARDYKNSLHIYEPSKPGEKYK